MSEKKIVFVDMDGVLANFEKQKNKIFNENPELIEKYKNDPDLIKDIFKNLEPIEGSIDAIQKLHDSGKYELIVATTAPWGNSESNTHKREWIEKYFGKIFYKNMVITHRKDLLAGDYLIDDRLANGASGFKGKLLRFGWSYEEKKWNDYPDWSSILNKLL